MKITNKKLIGALIAAYGLFYLLFAHETHQMYGLDWIVARLFGANGFPHTIHLILGALLALYGVLLFTGKMKIPKFLGRLYGQKKEY